MLQHVVEDGFTLLSGTLFQLRNINVSHSD